MSTKQDRAAPRTASDIERKYNFGKSFAEVFGLAQDAQDAAREAKDAAAEAQAAVGAIDHEAVFNLLTDNGKIQGVYKSEDGQIYINASYIAAGILASIDGAVQIDLDNGTFAVRQEFADALVGTLYGMFEATKNGIGLYGCDTDTKELVKTLSFSAAHLGSRGGKISQILATNAGLMLGAGGGTGEGYTLQLGLPNNTVIINRKTVSWKDNGDGTFTLIGT